MIKCPICNSQYNTLLTRRKNISPFQNKLFSTKQAACNIKKVDITIYICQQCGFVFNSDYDSEIILYDENYNNDQNASKFFETYVEESIHNLIDKGVKEGSRILEIGCGKYGKYLKQLMSNIDETCTAIGYDPVYNQEEELYEGRLRFVKTFYDFDKNRDEQVDLIISRHVIEHIQNPINMLSNISKIVGKSRQAKAFIETPNVSWILKNNAWFDFCYEHCSLFSPVSFEYCTQQVGMQVSEIKTTFGGQYMQAILANNNQAGCNKERLEGELEELNNLSLEYRHKESKRINKYEELLRKINIDGQTILWGAGAKANTFLNLLDQEQKYIISAVDINPAKSGKFISGTGHEIVSPNKIKELEVKNIIVMNSNYYEEIKKCLESQSIDLRKINIIEIEKVN